MRFLQYRLASACLPAAMLLPIFWPESAAATASLRCVSDPPVKVQVLGNLTQGLGGKLQALEVSLDAPTKDADQDLARHTFTINDLTQVWLDDDTVRLQLYWERPSETRFGSTEIVITSQVKADEEDVFTGRVVLTISDTINGQHTEGHEESPIVCSVG